MLEFEGDRYRLRVTNGDGLKLEWVEISEAKVRLYLSEKWPEIVVVLGILPDLDNFDVEWQGTRVQLGRLDEDTVPATVNHNLWERLSGIIGRAGNP